MATFTSHAVFADGHTVILEVDAEYGVDDGGWQTVTLGDRRLDGRSLVDRDAWDAAIAALRSEHGPCVGIT